MGIRQRSRLLTVAGLMTLFALTGIHAVSAHAQLKTSDPADKAILNKAPAQVLITFSEETDPLKSGGSVTDASGAAASTGFKVDLNERTKMTIDLKPNLPNGAYTVKWNSFTDDDNGVADGAFTFTIQAAAAGTGTPSGGASGSATAGGSAVASTAATGSAPSLPPAPAAATTAPTATRAATTAAATGTGGGIATTGTATKPPATLPITGNADGGNPPWALVLVIAAIIVVGGGLAVRFRAARSRT